MSDGITTSTFSEISVHADGERARILWEEPKGWVVILSSYGCWSYAWWSIGEQSLQEFLADLDSYYMGKKMLGADLDVLDPKETAQGIRQHILESRRDGDMNKDEASEEWDMVKQFEDGDMDFREWGSCTSICDQWEFARHEICSSWRYFWERLWVPHIVPILKQEALTQESE